MRRVDRRFGVSDVVEDEGMEVVEEEVVGRDDEIWEVISSREGGWKTTVR